MFNFSVSQYKYREQLVFFLDYLRLTHRNVQKYQHAVQKLLRRRAMSAELSVRRRSQRLRTRANDADDDDDANDDDDDDDDNDDDYNNDSNDNYDDSLFFDNIVVDKQ